MDLHAIQAALAERNIDAWLFYDHHHRDPIAYRVLGLPANLHVTRRWYYLISAKGEPRKLVHRIEAGHLDPLPGTKTVYSSWQEQQSALKTLLGGCKNVAMQYWPNNQVFTVSLVDAGTVDQIRGLGVNVVSSGDLVSRFEAALTAEQIRSHYAARDHIDRIMEATWKELGERCANGGTNEFAMQQFITEAFAREGLITDSPAIVGVNANSANPHYAPSAEVSRSIKKGDFVLIDMWGKLNQPDSVFYDITWTGIVGRSPSDREVQIFNTVRDARDTGFAIVHDAYEKKRRVCGWEVDKATRDLIERAGFGQYFIHRTGHSIGTEIHANGANMDNLEVRDEREIIPNTCFSVEPGIYLPEFGVRSEYDVIIHDGKAQVSGRIQTELVRV
jgi:Xaa-Pro aminopeptidase